MSAVLLRVAASRPRADHGCQRRALTREPGAGRRSRPALAPRAGRA